MYAETNAAGEAAARRPALKRTSFGEQAISVFNALIEHHGNAAIQVTRMRGNPCTPYPAKTSTPFTAEAIQHKPGTGWTLVMNGLSYTAHSQEEFALWVETSYKRLSHLLGNGDSKLTQPSVVMPFNRLF